MDRFKLILTIIIFSFLTCIISYADDLGIFNVDGVYYGPDQEITEVLQKSQETINDNITRDSYNFGSINGDSAYYRVFAKKNGDMFAVSGNNGGLKYRLAYGRYLFISNGGLIYASDDGRVYASSTILNLLKDLDTGYEYNEEHNNTCCVIINVDNKSYRVVTVNRQTPATASGSNARNNNDDFINYFFSGNSNQTMHNEEIMSQYYKWNISEQQTLNTDNIIPSYRDLSSIISNTDHHVQARSREDIIKRDTDGTSYITPELDLCMPAYFLTSIYGEATRIERDSKIFINGQEFSIDSTGNLQSGLFNLRLQNGDSHDTLGAVLVGADVGNDQSIGKLHYMLYKIRDNTARFIAVPMTQLVSGSLLEDIGQYNIINKIYNLKNEFDGDREFTSKVIYVLSIVIFGVLPVLILLRTTLLFMIHLLGPNDLVKFFCNWIIKLFTFGFDDFFSFMGRPYWVEFILNLMIAFSLWNANFLKVMQFVIYGLKVIKRYFNI